MCVNVLYSVNKELNRRTGGKSTVVINGTLEEQYRLRVTTQRWMDDQRTLRVSLSKGKTGRKKSGKDYGGEKKNASKNDI